MKIIDALKQKANKATDEVKIELELYDLAHKLEQKARVHLKRIITVLSEFDIHDEKHSEKVIENIEKLLGSKEVKKLSAYELFLLHLSAFFHDCAMAPSDWEINTMKLTEGNESFSDNNNSIRKDLKKPLMMSEAIQLIKRKKEYLYKKFDGDVKDWMFSPKDEDELISYLAELLIEYQNFRNGFADQIKAIQNQDEYLTLNKFIRTDYIRATHHRRIEVYVKNLESLFGSSFPQSAWGKKLAHDLAIICRSHGEDVSFIQDFSTTAQYYGAESANLQFVAVMLRLGDIIHFSYDRAPIDLRASRLFESAYSFEQWAIKRNGVNYTIADGTVTFRAYCESPDYYFKLHQYLDWIELEIQNYFKFERRWGNKRIPNFKDKVERANITHDKENFLPVRGLAFTLNQKKIIELLMGVGLYKYKYACIRELYQNSLDACRCMLAQNSISGMKAEGIIEFSLLRENDKVYLCCLDNGIGMTKDIIEQYLLKIGKSYYKSSDFYKQQANWQGGFTPTSQFGIGIISCFMIGTRIEITSKTKDDEYISCSIDGPHENFYYKNTSSLEKEKIPVSGTLIKIQLNKETKQELKDHKLEKLGLLLLSNSFTPLPEQFTDYSPYLKDWDNHLYNIVCNFLLIVPDNITVNILLADGKELALVNMPTLLSNERLGISDDDYEFADWLNRHRFLFPQQNTKHAEPQDLTKSYIICVSNHLVEYRTVLALPKKGFNDSHILPRLGISAIKPIGICIDGMYITHSKGGGEDEVYYTDALARSGIINFTGEHRPQLSVDRTSILHLPIECEKAAKAVSELLIKEIITVTKQHITTNGINDNDNLLNLIWQSAVEGIYFADIDFINELSLTEYGEIPWKGITDIIQEPTTIRGFLTARKVTIDNYYFSILDQFTQKLIIIKLMSATSVIIDGTSLIIEMEKFSPDNTPSNRIRKGEPLDKFYSFIIRADKWIMDDYYDIISNIAPIIPQRLFHLITMNQRLTLFQSDKVSIVHSYSNSITALFRQSPMQIKEDLGLYVHEERLFDKEVNNIYNFQQKRQNIHLLELNVVSIENASKEVYVVVAFISPIKLNSQEEKDLQKYKDTDNSYYKGVQEGWSLLITGMDTENIVIIPGKCTRDDLVRKLSDSFWEEYKEYTFKFTDGTIMQRIP